MAVNLPFPVASELKPVAGLELGYAMAAIKKENRKDLLVIRLAEGATVAGVFTKNRFCAAPVQICRDNLAKAKASGKGIRALMVNTGNANAGTGESGYRDAIHTSAELAGLLGVAPEQVLPFSTGVILEPLPVDRLIAGLPAAVAGLKADNWLNAAEAIMTTDTIPKAASRTVQLDGKTVTVTGICKGAGMIHPNMATMLGFMATDAAIPQEVLEGILEYAVSKSFNCITVDGDTSTNDSLILMATGKVDVGITGADSANCQALRDAVTGLAQELSQKIIRDGEGASKFITITVEQGGSEEECRKIAYAIAHSPLVKTAFFASDPNLGRILAAIGYAGVEDLDVGKLELYLDDVLVARDGGRNPAYREEDGQRVMDKPEILVRVVLARGNATATVWTCDLTHDYVSINADYRS